MLLRSSGSQQGPGNAGPDYFCDQHVAVPLQRDVAQQLADLRPRPHDVMPCQAAEIGSQRPRQQFDDVGEVEGRRRRLQFCQFPFGPRQPLREDGRRPQQPGCDSVGLVRDLGPQFLPPRGGRLRALAGRKP